MIESKENKVEQLKVDPDTKSRVHDLVEIVRKRTGKKPTHSAVIKAAMDALEQMYQQNHERTAKTQQEAPKPSDGGEVPRYRKPNLPWHDRLEMVLNDTDEALGIQKNLEWAERTVREKQKRPAGKRASGM